MSNFVKFVRSYKVLVILLHNPLFNYKKTSQKIASKLLKLNYITSKNIKLHCVDFSRILTRIYEVIDF